MEHQLFRLGRFQEQTVSLPEGSSWNTFSEQHPTLPDDFTAELRATKISPPQSQIRMDCSIFSAPHMFMP